MGSFKRVIFKDDMPLYLAAIQQMVEAEQREEPIIELVETEPSLREDIVMLHIRYAEQIDLFMLGFHIGQAKLQAVKGGQHNG